MGNVVLQVLTSSYMNCRVRADLPTPPLPTMITLWRTRDVWFLFLPEAMTEACRQRGGGGEGTNTHLCLGLSVGENFQTTVSHHLRVNIFVQRVRK